MGDESLETVDGRTVDTTHGLLVTKEYEYVIYTDSEIDRIRDFVTETEQFDYNSGVRTLIHDDGEDYEAAMQVVDNNYIVLTCEAHEPVIATVDEWREALGMDDQQSFADYVRENIEHGSYEYDDEHEMCDLRMTEYLQDDGINIGRGFIIPDTIRSAVEDENVIVVGVGNGWLELDDNRGDNE